MMLASGKDEDIGSRNSFIQSLKVANGDSLEKRLKKELEEQVRVEAKILRRFKESITEGKG